MGVIFVEFLKFFGRWLSGAGRGTWFFRFLLIGGRRGGVTVSLARVINFF